MDQEIKRWRAGEKLAESEWTSSIADLSANFASNSDSLIFLMFEKIFLSDINFND
jgi:hypothetical protein